MKISVIIPAYKAEDTLEQTIKSVKNDKDKKDEIIIVKSGQPLNFLKKSNNLTIKSLVDKMLPGMARNYGANLATGKILLFLDSDMQLIPGTLEIIRKELKENEILTGAVSLKERKNIWSTIEHDFFFHEFQLSMPPSNRKNAPGGLIAINTNSFKKENGFSNMPRMQDTEFTERLNKNGYNIKFNPKIRANRIDNSSFSILLKKVYINGYNRVKLNKSNKNSLFKSFFVFISYLLRGILKGLRIAYRNIRYNPNLSLIEIPFFIILGIIWSIGALASMTQTKETYHLER